MSNMDNQDKKICTIIITFNFEKWIDKCLESLRRSSTKTTVLVIDNNSSDNTCSIINQKYPEVILIDNKENLGFGKANNIGFKYAIDNGFEFVFLLNQDAWIEKNTLEELVSTSHTNSDYGIISPIHLNGTGERLDFGFATYIGINNINDIPSGDNKIVSCNFINAAFWLIPTTILKQVGGFAHIFPHYGEDVNYAQRVAAKGFKIGYTLKAIAYHDRENRKVSRDKFFYSEYIYFLTEAVNIRHTQIRAFGFSTLAPLKKAMLSIAKGSIKDEIAYIYVAIQITKHRKQIIRTRRSSKETGAYL